MLHPSKVLEAIRSYKSYCQDKLYFAIYQMDRHLNAENEIKNFSPANTREHIAWMAWYLRGVEGAEENLAGHLIPELIEDE